MRKQQIKYWSSLYWRRIYFKFFLKYMAGFLLILAPSILIVLISWSITQDQVVTAGQLRFQEGMTEIAAEISKMSILENDIQSSDYFRELAKVQEEIPWGKQLTLSYATNQLRDMRYLYDFSPYFFVLFENNDLYVSTQQCDDQFSQWYYGNMMKASCGEEALDALSFRDMILNGRGNKYSFIKLDSISYYIDKEYHVPNPIICVVSEDYVLHSDMGYRMAYVIDPKTLVEMLLAEECREDGFMRITDRDGNVLLNYGDTSGITGDSDTVTDVGEHFMISARDIGETGWLVQIGIPKTVILEQIHVLYKFVYIYVVLGLLMVVTLAYYFGRRQYWELKKFYSLIPERESYVSEGRELSWESDPEKDPKPVREQNEYEVLMEIFQHMAKDSESYLKQKRELEQQNQAIRLEKLIAGGINTQEERLELENAQIINAEFYCVAVVRMLVKEQQEYGMALLGLKGYLQKNWPDRIFHIHTGVYDELFVLSMSSEGEPNVDNVQKLFENAAHILNDEMEITLSVGISTVGTDLSNLKRCYAQASQVLEAYFQEEKSVVNYYCIDMDKSEETVANPDFLIQLYHCITHLNGEGVQKCFLMVRAYYHKYPVPFEMQKEQYFYSVRNMIFNAMVYFSEKPGESGMLPGYEKTDSPDVMTEKLQRAAEELIERMIARKKVKREMLREEMFSFLEQNYTNKNMSVSLACAELGVSERYLQSVIRDKTGDTFAVYLEKLRVKKAVDLLLNTDRSNEQIADEVGFVTVSTFYRAFNRRMGMSPKAFREE